MEFVFDFPNDRAAPKSLRFTEPVEVHVATSIAQVRGVMEAATDAAARGCWAAGFVAYEAGPAFDSAVVARDDPDFPLALFAVFDRPVGEPECETGAYHVGQWEPEIGRAQYDASVAAVREQIAAGATYQTNLTLRLRAEFAGDPRAYYEALRSQHATPYAAYLDVGRFCIASLSPELFLRRDGRLVVTEPMKGTAARGRWRAEDLARQVALKDSPKERAENVMIVDLMRSDLGRIAATGSVRVSQLFETLPLPSVWQMISRVECEVDEGVTATDLFNATFPPGSVTGAPKPMTTAVIERLETSPRRAYCGAIGYIAPGGRCVFNVAIRTVLIDRERGRAECGVGGGITWDSRAEDEYQEALSKAAFLNVASQEFRLLETMLFDRDGFFLLRRHLGRLAFSADVLGFAIDLDRIERDLLIYANTLTSVPQRVRLLVSRAGGIEIQSSALGEPPPTARVALAKGPMDITLPFIYHKTDQRAMYEKHFAPDYELFDVLLWNADGFVTEFTRGNVVAKLDGALATPPLTAGCLPGVFREELLAQGSIVKRDIAVSDLERCEELWFVNSVRKWQRVELGRG